MFLLIYQELSTKFEPQEPSKSSASLNLVLPTRGASSELSHVCIHAFLHLALAEYTAHVSSHSDLCDEAGDETAFCKGKRMANYMPRSVYLWACWEKVDPSDEEVTAGDFVVGWLTLQVIKTSAMQADRA